MTSQIRASLVKAFEDLKGFKLEREGFLAGQECEQELADMLGALDRLERLKQNLDDTVERLARKNEHLVELLKEAPKRSEELERYNSSLVSELLSAIHNLSRDHHQARVEAFVAADRVKRLEAFIVEKLEQDTFLIF